MNSSCAEVEREIIGTVVDSDGVILDYIYAGDRVLHKDEKKPTDIYYLDFNKDKSFVKLYGGMTELKKRLSNPEFAVAISLSDYVCYEDCILREGGHKSGKILDVHDLCIKLDMNYEQLRKLIASLIKKGILGTHKTGSADNANILMKSITVNPWIYTRGSKVNKMILGLFEKSGWQSIMK